ncbi:MAG: molybdopterin-binding protein [Sarcina sp.]
MRKIATVDAIGHILCHDITQIIPGKFKGVAFKKGHVVREEDIEKLLSCGKENLYIWEKTEGMLHENEAAERLRNVAAGEGLEFSDIREGKINFIAKEDGLLKVNIDLLKKFNCMDEMMLASLHNNTAVKKGQQVGGTRIIPLVIEEEKIKKLEEVIGNEKIIEVKPFRKLKVGIVTTGNEVFCGRIKDAFGPVLKKKLSSFNCEIVEQKFMPDDKDKIVQAINDFINLNVDLILCTGGMSVDPDDITPIAIKETGASIISYGAPLLPGAMFLVAFKGELPILGLPGCVMYAKSTAFDVMLPRILVGEKISKEDIAEYGHGGFCSQCEVCTYPVCHFGKGC